MPKSIPPTYPNYWKSGCNCECVCIECKQSPQFADAFIPLSGPGDIPHTIFTLTCEELHQMFTGKDTRSSNEDVGVFLNPMKNQYPDQ